MAFRGSYSKSTTDCSPEIKAKCQAVPLTSAQCRSQTFLRSEVLNLRTGRSLFIFTRRITDWIGGALQTFILITKTVARPSPTAEVIRQRYSVNKEQSESEVCLPKHRSFWFFQCSVRRSCQYDIMTKLGAERWFRTDRCSKWKVTVR